MRAQVFLFLVGGLVLTGAGCATVQNQSAEPLLPNPTSTTPVVTTVSSTTSSEAVLSTHPLSLPRLFDAPLNGSDFRLGNVLSRTEAYTRYYITYKSGQLVISGIMNVPTGPGPFPVLILNHGHIDTSIYTNGRGLKREQDYLARAGYIVVHPDYRNHAQSSKDPRDEVAVRLGYVEDVLNAIDALKKANLSYVDLTRVGMLGHSMGGGITLAALTAHPELIKAAVLYAPVSGDQRKSYERWMSRRPDSAQRIRDAYGAPEQQPEFWKNISSDTFYDRITAPIHIFHGTADADVPLAWSEETRDLLLAKNKSVELTIYPNAPHEFAADWSAFMERTEQFFDETL